MDKIIKFQPKNKNKFDNVFEKPAKVFHFLGNSRIFLEEAKSKLLINDYVGSLKNNFLARKSAGIYENRYCEVTFAVFSYISTSNFELALKYSFLMFLDLTPFSHIIVRCLLELNRVKDALRFVQSRVDNNLLSKSEIDILRMEIEKNDTYEVDSEYNLALMKADIIQSINNKDFETAGKLLQTYFTMDPSDPYISYLYYNLDEAFSGKVYKKIPEMAKLSRLNHIIQSMQDTESFEKLLKDKYNESLVRFVLLYADDEIVKQFVIRVCKSKNMFIKYLLQEELMGDISDKRKIFVFEIATRHCREVFDRIRYKNLFYCCPIYNNKLNNFPVFIEVFTRASIKVIKTTNIQRINFAPELMLIRQNLFTKEEDWDDYDFFCDVLYFKFCYRHNRLPDTKGMDVERVEKYWTQHGFDFVKFRKLLKLSNVQIMKKLPK